MRCRVQKASTIGLPKGGRMTDKITLDVNGSIATITNRNVEKHNAFDDEMDAELFAIFDELAATQRCERSCGEARGRAGRRAATCRRSAPT